MGMETDQYLDTPETSMIPKKGRLASQNLRRRTFLLSTSRIKKQTTRTKRAAAIENPEMSTRTFTGDRSKRISRRWISALMAGSIRSHSNNFTRATKSVRKNTAGLKSGRRRLFQKLLNEFNLATSNRLPCRG